MSNRKSQPVIRLLKATQYSIAGIKSAFLHEQSFRIEILVLIAAIPAGLFFGGTAVEKTLLIGSWLLVITVELLNSAIEAALDRMGTEPNELAGRAKDLGSAAVLCAIILAAMTWILILTD
ncbi:MAG: diacylglycerol kinase [Pseudomonadota bacterium]